MTPSMLMVDDHIISRYNQIKKQWNNIIEVSSNITELWYVSKKRMLNKCILIMMI